MQTSSAEYAEVLRDALRYRWLKKQCVPFLDWKVSTVVRVEGQRPESIWLTEAHLDTAIDNAMLKDHHDAAIAAAGEGR